LLETLQLGHSDHLVERQVLERCIAEQPPEEHHLRRLEFLRLSPPRLPPSQRGELVSAHFLHLLGLIHLFPAILLLGTQTNQRADNRL
jgi:hypothetical protein